MKKLFIVLFLVLGTVSIAFADVSGEDLYGINFCQKVNRNDFTAYGGMQFVKDGGSSTYLHQYNQSYYAVTVVYVGYNTSISQSGYYNNTALGTNTSYFKCPGTYSNQTDDRNTFRAGRIINWLIPASLNPGAGNTVRITVNGHTISTSNL